MIFTQWGRPLKIIGNGGEHKKREYPLPVTLVKVRHHDDTNHTDFEQWRLTVNMKADGGLKEINEAVSSAPKLRLSKNQLETALSEAF